MQPHEPHETTFGLAKPSRSLILGETTIWRRDLANRSLS